ncbi:MAG: exosortase/archaeosortase family protein [Planctomycetota bacterium]
MQGALIGAALLIIYQAALLAYLRDQHYQEHFVFLWTFLALALWRSARGPFRDRFGLRSGRDRLGIGLALIATLILAPSELAGSSTGVRTSLVVFMTGCAVLAAPGWSIKRCLIHGGLMLMCFGLPYSVYFPLTSQFQHGVASIIAWPSLLGLADYEVASTVVRFPHYELAITPDCSGLGQLLTFGGIAALGVLRSAPNRKRTLLVFGLAVALAWLSNVARVALFVFLVGIGWTQSVDNATWHAVIGTLVFVPFVAVLIAVLLRTHAPPSIVSGQLNPSGRIRIAWLLAPLAAVHFALATGSPSDLPEPPYMSALLEPPAHELECRAPSESSDRGAYSTPWLINARFRRSPGVFFDLLHYSTSSRSHLCVHKVAACLFAPDQVVTYLPVIEVDGRLWWRIDLTRPDPANSQHVYFAFELGEERRDDSAATQFEVLWKRVFGASWQVKLTRVMMPGAMPESPTGYESEVLTWLGRTTS